MVAKYAQMLEQLGANHTVTEAKTLLDKHLNKQAHGEE